MAKKAKEKVEVPPEAPSQKYEVHDEAAAAVWLEDICKEYFWYSNLVGADKQVLMGLVDYQKGKVEEQTPVSTLGKPEEPIDLGEVPF